MSANIKTPALMREFYRIQIKDLTAEKDSLLVRKSFLVNLHRTENRHMTEYEAVELDRIDDQITEAQREIYYFQARKLGVEPA